MKMVKSLLLGSAAGLVAVAGAQAADLPVKAKPVEYVKVCSLYGAGFWYVPGTDTCLKIGSYVRVQTSSATPATAASRSASARPTRRRPAASTRTDTSQLSIPHPRRRLGRPAHADRIRHAAVLPRGRRGSRRARTTARRRPTTWSSSTAASSSSPASRRAASGRTSTSTRWRRTRYGNNRVSGDTGALGLYGIAYTAQFGNGVSATLSFEDGGSSAQGNNAARLVARSLRANWRWRAFGLGTTAYDNEGWKVPGRGRRAAHRPGLGLCAGRGGVA